MIGDLQQLAPVVKEDEWALLKQHYASAFFFHSKALAATRYVAIELKHPHEIHAFLLDTPVCLYKGVWHEVIALSQEALYKITENREVSSQFHPLEHPLGFQIQNIE